MNIDDTTPQPDGAGLTPPPAAEHPQPAPPAPAVTPRSTGFVAASIVTAVVGAIALVGAGGTAAVAATGALISASSQGNGSELSVDVDGVTSLDVDVDAGGMQVRFGDVEDAELVVSNTRDPGWTLERDGDQLKVASPDRGFGWWFGGWFGGDETAVLTLPQTLGEQRLDADLTLDAGSLDVDGDFGDLTITVSAGALDIEGAASSVDIGMSAGRADVLLDSVDRAVLGMSAGNMTVELTGRAPSQTSVEVSAGSVDLTLPDVAYDITQDISAGSLDAGVDQSSSARNRIDVSLSAGSVSIRPGR